MHLMGWEIKQLYECSIKKVNITFSSYVMTVSITTASQTLCMVSGLPIPNNFISFFFGVNTAVSLLTCSLSQFHTLNNHLLEQWARWYLPSFTTTTIYICVLALVTLHQLSDAQLQILNTITIQPISILAASHLNLHMNKIHKTTNPYVDPNTAQIFHRQRRKMVQPI